MHFAPLPPPSPRRANPNAFWDNRFNKLNERAPDFKAKDKERDVALWLTSRAKPAWVDEFLTKLDAAKAGAGERRR
jgi:hypothetical protein